MQPQDHPVLYAISMALSALTFAWLIWRYIRTIQAKPQFDASEVVFQEWFASGRSSKNFLTKIAGANNCLRLVVAKDFLWVTSYFPFSLVIEFSDLEHVIPLRSISSVEASTGVFGRKRLNVTFTTTEGECRTLYLYPKKPDQLLAALGKNETERQRQKSH